MKVVAFNGSARKDRKRGQRPLILSRPQILPAACKHPPCIFGEYVVYSPQEVRRI